MEEIQMEENTNVIPSKNKKSNGCLGIFIANVIAWGILILIIYLAINSASSEKDYSQEAYTAAKFYVNKQLKAPATADYPMYDKNFITHHNDSYTVSSYVDAENSFGVKGRLYYTVTMERDGKDWINVNVNLSE